MFIILLERLNSLFQVRILQARIADFISSGGIAVFTHATEGWHVSCWTGMLWPLRWRYPLRRCRRSWEDRGNDIIYLISQPDLSLVRSVIWNVRDPGLGTHPVEFLLAKPKTKIGMNNNSKTNHVITAAVSASRFCLFAFLLNTLINCKCFKVWWGDLWKPPGL